MVGTTFTLTADCDTTEPLEVPDGFTVDGAGFTITAHDPATVPFDRRRRHERGDVDAPAEPDDPGHGFPHVTCDF